MASYDGQVPSILSEFDRRFTDFASIEPVVSQYLCFPFGENIDVDCITSKVASLFNLDSCAIENEILALQNGIELQSRATPDMKVQFWNLLQKDKYPKLRQTVQNLTALFGSTYLCESAFSQMSKYRSTMTDDHLAASLGLALSSYCPDYERLASSSQCQVPH